MLRCALLTFSSLAIPLSTGAPMLNGAHLLVIPLIEETASPSALDEAGQRQDTRTVASRRGTLLRDYLRPTDNELIIEYDGPPPLRVIDSPGLTQVEWLTSLSPFVGLIKVQERVSSITPSGDWIQTQVKAVVTEVLKNETNTPVLIGREVSFLEPGGALQVDGRLVRAQVKWLALTQIGRTYLVFGTFDEDGRLRTGPVSSYDVSGNHLKALFGRPGSQAEPIESREKDHVLDEIRALGRKKPGF